MQRTRRGEKRPSKAGVEPPDDAAIRSALAKLAAARGRERTFCPSEAARALSVDWRSLMPKVRRVAALMPELRATQGGVEVEPLSARGPIRLSLR
jgi:hypothetical protein